MYILYCIYNYFWYQHLWKLWKKILWYVIIWLIYNLNNLKSYVYFIYYGGPKNNGLSSWVISNLYIFRLTVAKLILKLQNQALFLMSHQNIASSIHNKIEMRLIIYYMDHILWACISHFRYLYAVHTIKSSKR